jgi:hypothetical protein
MQGNGRPRRSPGFWTAARAAPRISLSSAQGSLALLTHIGATFPAAGCRPPAHTPLAHPLPRGPRRPPPSDLSSPPLGAPGGENSPEGGWTEGNPPGRQRPRSSHSFVFPLLTPACHLPPGAARSSRRRWTSRGDVSAGDALRRSWANPAHIHPGNGLGLSPPGLRSIVTSVRQPGALKILPHLRGARPPFWLGPRVSISGTVPPFLAKTPTAPPDLLDALAAPQCGGCPDIQAQAAPGGRGNAPAEANTPGRPPASLPVKDVRDLNDGDASSSGLRPRLSPKFAFRQPP